MGVKIHPSSLDGIVRRLRTIPTPVRAGGHTHRRQAPPLVFPITLSSPTGAAGDKDTQCSRTYTVTDAITKIELGTSINPSASPHVWRRHPKGTMTEATAGLAYRKADGTLVITWINEVLNTGPCETPTP